MEDQETNTWIDRSMTQSDNGTHQTQEPKEGQHEMVKSDET